MKTLGHQAANKRSHRRQQPMSKCLQLVVYVCNRQVLVMTENSNLFETSFFQNIKDRAPLAAVQQFDDLSDVTVPAALFGKNVPPTASGCPPL